MSDATELYLVLAAIYVAECIVRAPRGAVAFLPRLVSGWKILPGSRFYGNPRWGLFITHPVPALAPAVVCELWPVSIGPGGIYSFVTQAFNPGERHEQVGRFHRFEDIRTAEPAGAEILINGEVFVRTASPLFAARLSDLIRRLGRLPHDRRAAAIDGALDEALNSSAIAARAADFASAGRSLQVIGTVFFIHLFIVCPLAVWHYGLEMTWLGLLAVLLVLDVVMLVLFHRAHRRLYLRWTSDRWSHLATMMLLPLATLRGPAYLARHLLSEYHPLAVAGVLCSRETFAAFAGAALRDLDNPIASAATSDEFLIADTEQFFRARLSAAIRGFLDRHGLDPAALTAPPVRDGEDHLSYCPRCHCQFIIPAGACEVCRQPLHAWDERELTTGPPSGGIQRSQT